jgi:glycosyltransferase involved in cell wall biosynthesis
VDLFSYRRLYPRLFFPGRTELDPGPSLLPAGAPPDRTLDPLRPASWRRVGEAVAARRPDVVLLQRWHPFFAPALARVARTARGAGARAVWMVHNARPHEKSAFPWGPLLTLGMRPEDRVLTHAESEARILTDLGVRAPIEVLPMPVPEVTPAADPEAARRELGIARGEVVFLFFGYVRAYKGVEVLLEALALLDRDGAPWRALLVGEWYVKRPPLEPALRRAGEGGRVDVVDRYVSEAEAERYFAAATAVVLPYRSGTQSAVIPLAYAHGRGVVTTRVGGLEDAVEEGATGLLVPPGDARSLAAALEEVRRGKRFDPAALRRARERSGFATLVEWLEAVATGTRQPSM